LSICMSQISFIKSSSSIVRLVGLWLNTFTLPCLAFVQCMILKSKSCNMSIHLPLFP
jgi:hypothetical protein